MYTTNARHDEGKDPRLAQLERQILAALAERGDKAETDDALGDTASWLLHEALAGHNVESIAAESTSHVFGFGGAVRSCATFFPQREAWREQLQQLPKNFRVNRVGLGISSLGGLGAIVLGFVDLQLEPISPTLELGQSLKVSGSVSTGFKSTTVYVQKPDGTVDEHAAADTRLDLTLEPQVAGEYRVEVMGDGPGGPVVLTNLPVFVGLPATGPASIAGKMLPPEQAELRLLELLNAARQDMKLAPLVTDAQLRLLALSHTTEMRDQHFFAHTSPTTGTTDERFQRSGIAVSLFGEDIVLAGSPEGAHQGLMTSPGHRVAMISPDFTHVGIGVLESNGQLLATYHFGRRPGPEAVPSSAAQVVATISALRTGKGLPEIHNHPAFAAAAAAGAKALAKGADGKKVARVVGQIVQSQVDNGVFEPLTYCIYQEDLLEAEQLKASKALMRPTLRRVGVGVQRHDTPAGLRAATVFLVDGPECE